MEKPKPKPKKSKTIQITYPAPYSQSWTPDVQPVLMKNKVGGSTSLFHRSKRPPVSTRAWSQEFPPDRPDPTAPHLKYGVFRNRRGAPPKPLQKMEIFPKMNRIQRMPLVISPVKRIKCITNQASKRPQCVNSRNSSNVAPMKPVEHVLPEFPPKFVFRNTDKSYSRDLSFSKVSHLDIKPKITGSVSPSFCPTPHFRTLSRRLTLSPT